MINRHEKKSSTSFTLRGMQTKSTIRYYLISVRMTCIKKERAELASAAVVVNKELLSITDGNASSDTSCKKIVWRFFKKIKLEILYEPILLAAINKESNMK